MIKGNKNQNQSEDSSNVLLGFSSLELMKHFGLEDLGLQLKTLVIQLTICSTSGNGTNEASKL